MDLGTIILISPFILGIFFAVLQLFFGNDWYIGYKILSVISFAMGVFIVFMASVIYIETSKYEHERNSIQSTLDNARKNGSQYELAAITREVMHFNLKIETHQNYWHPNFRLWINENILDIEPVK